MTFSRPTLITVLGGLCLLNAVAALALGAVTLGGSRLLYTPLGAGSGRVAAATLLGPWAPHVGWVMLVLGLGAAALGGGLLKLRPWSRRLLLIVAVLAALATSGAVVWGVAHHDWGVVVSGVLKVALYVALTAYLRSAGVQAAFRTPAI